MTKIYSKIVRMYILLPQFLTKDPVKLSKRNHPEVVLSKYL